MQPVIKDVRAFKEQKEFMFLSPTQNNDATKDFHQESSAVNHWWVMDCAACKTLTTLFLILRRCLGINIKSRCNNLNIQNFQFVLNSTARFTSAQSDYCPNKLINADCQTVAFFLKARCAAGY